LPFLEITVTIYTQFFDFLKVNCVGNQNSKLDLSFPWMNFRHNAIRGGRKRCKDRTKRPGKTLLFKDRLRILRVLAVPFRSIVRTGQETFEFNPGVMDTGVASEISDPYMSSDPYMDAATRSSSTSKFYGLPSEMDRAWLTEIYRHYSQVPYWTEKGERSPTALDLSESTQFMGAEVLYPKGEAAGRIHDLVIDSSDGHIAFLVLSDVMGRGDTLVAVPFSALTRRGGNAFVLNATEEQLASASSFDQPEDLSNPRWAEDVYRYFGQSPYWTSGGQMGSPTMGQPMEEEKSEDEYMEP
jgi:hypothetical protein